MCKDFFLKFYSNNSLSELGSFQSFFAANSDCISPFLKHVVQKLKILSYFHFQSGFRFQNRFTYFWIIIARYFQNVQKIGPNLCHSRSQELDLTFLDLDLLRRSISSIFRFLRRLYLNRCQS